MEDFLLKSSAAGAKRELIELFERTIFDLGYRYYAYHTLARDFQKNDLVSSLRCYKVPHGWLECYAARNYFPIDPIQIAAAGRSAPFTWSEIRLDKGLTRAQKEFFEDLSEVGFGAGVSVPVFPQPGVFSYFCFGSGEDALSLSPVELLKLQAVCFVMHLRFDQLTETPRRSNLSPREAEVAALVAAGRTNNEIATHLGITSNTVDTMVKRCLAKLNAKSRIDLALHALAKGLTSKSSPCPLEPGNACNCAFLDGPTPMCVSAHCDAGGDKRVQRASRRAAR